MEGLGLRWRQWLEMVWRGLWPGAVVFGLRSRAPWEGRLFGFWDFGGLRSRWWGRGAALIAASSLERAETSNQVLSKSLESLTMVENRLANCSLVMLTSKVGSSAMAV